jgi:hypothetical protein
LTAHRSGCTFLVDEKGLWNSYATLLGEACKQLSVSEATFRRLKASEVISRAYRIEAWSGRSVRVLTRDDIERVRPAIARWKMRR